MSQSLSKFFMIFKYPLIQLYWINEILFKELTSIESPICGDSLHATYFALGTDPITFGIIIKINFILRIICYQ